MQHNIPEKLAEAMLNNKLVLFIGSGCSTPIGYPNWNNLIIQILQHLDEIHGEYSDTHFKNIISKLQDNSIEIFEALDKIEIDEKTKVQYKTEAKAFLSKQFENIESKNIKSDIHSLLWEISTKIFTTNYDKELEKYKPSDKVINVFENKNRFQSIKSQLDNSQFLYKLHGDYQNPETVTLFRSDYNDIYNSENHNEDALKNFFNGKTFLFIGFSLTDPFINDLFENVKKMYGGYSFSNHFILTTKNEDYSKYNVKTILLKNYSEDLINFLLSLKMKKNNSNMITNELTANNNVSNDLQALNELFKIKVDLLKTNPSDVKLYDEIKDIEAKIKKSIFYEFDYLHKINPIYKNSEIKSLFEKIYSSLTFDDQTIERINYIRNDSLKYYWYDRSALVSAITCSLIHFNKADETKISFLIDFINDNEDKVWQKATTSLFMSLNHLGNKWLRLEVKNKLKNLQEIPKIQDAFFSIIQLFNINFHKFSFLDEKIFQNEYFKDNPFNYFLPFFDDKTNEGFVSLFDNYDGNIDNAITFLNESSLPDQLKYLLCNSDMLNENDKLEKKHRNKSSNQIVFYNSIFYPFSIHVHELINFYRFFPEFKHKEILKSQLKITETPIKEYLLNQLEKRKALASHFMKEKMWGQAIVNLKEAEKLKPNNIEVLINLANSYKNGEFYEEEYLTRLKIFDLDDKDENNIEGLYWYYDRNENLSKSLLYSEMLIEIDSENSYYYSLKALILEKYGKFEKSRNELDKAISLDKSIGSYYYYRAFLNLYLGDYNTAYSDLESADELGYEKANILNCYANYYRLQNNIEKALECINSALELSQDAVLYGTKAVIYSSAGNDDLFYEFLTRAINKGASAHRLYPDIKEKYKNDEKFKDLLQQHKQKLFLFD